METKIKKLNKLVLNNKAYNIMAAQQMKFISGGYDLDSGDIGCNVECPGASEHISVSDCHASTVRAACGVEDISGVTCGGESYCI